MAFREIDRTDAGEGLRFFVDDEFPPPRDTGGPMLMIKDDLPGDSWVAYRCDSVDLDQSRKS